ncbi:MAG: BamA/TamA family outer membrane protein [Candidatus Cloacimonetes bacterium]|nr:BamA/TamA family outer membrane protein [Candidatus Cloacimonadota bacterium]
MKKYYFFLLFILSNITLYSMDFIYYFNVKDSLQIGITGAPYGSYSSETGIGLGINLILIEKTKPDIINTFDLRLDTFYSQENEKELSVSSTIPLRKNNQLINFEAKYKSRPQSFYGIGPNTDKNNKIEIQKNYYRLKGDWNQIFSNNISLGIACDFSGFHNEFNNDIIENFTYNGYKNFYRTLGLGSKLVINKKDKNTFPTKGYYYKNQFMIYNKNFISDYNFYTLSQEFQYFFSIDKHIIANQIVAENNFKNIPFHYLSEQGGAYIMRGYSTGRFIEKHFIGIQSEYRAPIILWRVSPVLFCSAGNSFKKYKDINKHNLHITGGFGFRFALDTNRRLNVRADVGFSNEGKQIYLKFGESF